MSDFSFTHDALRGDVARALYGNLEQTAWVLAELAEDAAPGTRCFGELAEAIEALDAESRTALVKFCSAIIDQEATS